MSHPKLSATSWQDFEEEMPMRERMAELAAFDPDADPEWTRFLVLMMEMLGAWRFCPRHRCRRAKHWLTRKIDCAFRHKPWLCEHMLPLFLSDGYDTLPAGKEP